jgi:5-formyltetrahydrofolate cyclo-ligase
MVIHVSVQGNGPLNLALDAKRIRRKELITRRRGVSQDERSAESAALAVQVRDIDLSGRVVCAYVPCGTEPGSVEFVEAIAAACAELLLPVVTGASPLDWSEYTGPDSLAPAAFGLLEPIGPRLGAAAISRADVIFVPALAVDRKGVRLGRGGGHYDRSLPLARPEARLIAVVRDGEIVDDLPSEPHDIRVGWTLTPHGGLDQRE